MAHTGADNDSTQKLVLLRHVTGPTGTIGCWVCPLPASSSAPLDRLDFSTPTALLQHPKGQDPYLASTAFDHDRNELVLATTGYLGVHGDGANEVYREWRIGTNFSLESVKPLGAAFHSAAPPQIEMVNNLTSVLGFFNPSAMGPGGRQKAMVYLQNPAAEGQKWVRVDVKSAADPKIEGGCWVSPPADEDFRFVHFVASCHATPKSGATLYIFSMRLNLYASLLKGEGGDLLWTTSKIQIDEYKPDGGLGVYQLNSLVTRDASTGKFKLQLLMRLTDNGVVKQPSYQFVRFFVDLRADGSVETTKGTDVAVKKDFNVIKLGKEDLRSAHLDFVAWGNRVLMFFDTYSGSRLYERGNWCREAKVDEKGDLVEMREVEWKVGGTDKGGTSYCCGIVVVPGDF